MRAYPRSRSAKPGWIFGIGSNQGQETSLSTLARWTVRRYSFSIVSDGKTHDRPGLARRIWNRCAGLFNRLCRDRKHVFVYDPRSPPPPDPVDLRIERYERVEDVPPEVLSALSGYASGKEFEWDAREIRDHAVYWVGYLDGQVVGTRMSRRGQYFRSWFVPLEKNDIVIFRGRTLPPFRGRGISAVMLRYIISREVAAGGRAFTDCDVYNKPSIRAIGKAGFRRIATKKSISRREALGAA